jgi:hypothetical protein
MILRFSMPQISGELHAGKTSKQTEFDGFRASPFRNL